MTVENLPAADPAQSWTRKLARFYTELLKQGGGSSGTHLYQLSKTAKAGYVADLSTFELTGSHIFGSSDITLKIDPTDSELVWQRDESDLDDPDANLADSDPPEGAEEDQFEIEFVAGRKRARAALLRIYKKQKTDNFNRETLLGYPIVAGKSGNRKISGPLLYWEVEPIYDASRQQLTIVQKSGNPSLNTRLLSGFESEDAVIETLKDQLLPILTAEEFGEAELRKVVQTVHGIVPALEALESFESSPSHGLAELLATSLAPHGKATIGYWPILINGPKSHAFLLEDLEEIGTRDEHISSSVLSQLVGGMPKGIGEVEGTTLPYLDTVDGGDPLWFPFESNQSQRRVAEAAKRAAILTVQGPPGTGKSLTIANLICDLVTRGKSVLVTSHQMKALEVVAKKIPDIDYLAMAVLRDDVESMSKLKAQLTSTNVVANESLSTARSQVDQLRASLTALDRELRGLTRRYTELKALENENFSGHSYYDSIRHLDVLDPEDDPAGADFQFLADALREWCDLALHLRRALPDLRAIFRSDDLDLTRSEEKRLAENLSTLTRMARRAMEPPSASASAILRTVDRAGVKAAPVAASLKTFHAWVEAAAPGFLERVGQANAEVGWKAWLRRSRNTPDQEIESILQEIAKAEDYLTTLGDGPLPPQIGLPEVTRLEWAADKLEECGKSFFRWHFAKVARNARRELTASGFSGLERKNAGKLIALVRRAALWNRQLAKINAMLGRAQQLIPEWQGGEQPGSTVVELAARFRSLRRAIDVLGEVREIPVLADLRHPYPELAELLGEDLSSGGRAAAAAAALESADRLTLREGVRDLRSRLTVPPRWKSTVTEMLDAIEGDPGSIDDRKLRLLTVLTGVYPQFQRLIDLEEAELSALGGTRRTILNRIESEGAIPDWLEQAETALEAHRLGSLMRGVLGAQPDNLTSVSQALREGQVKRRRLIEKIIRSRRRLEVRQAMSEPAVSIPLHQLRGLLNRRRLTDTFVSQRKRIDYEAVLKVFPAWICTIDDAARLFPLKEGLFDYLIVDEASQCSQSAALPLAYRAKRMIVVGDEHQLQPAASRFMKEANISLLQEKNGINDHPHAEILNGKESLLNVAERFKNHRAFLNEHFRCDPSIIRWSNRNFYNDQLRILTHRRADAFAVPLEVRELRDTDDDPEKKVNVGEAEAVIAEVRRLIESGEADRLKIGLISPFRDQANLLQTLLMTSFSDHPEWIDRYDLVASTADGFQGDERDIILYSFRYGPSTSPGSVLAIQREYQRLNVAFTRAKRKAICFISAPVSRFPEGHLRGFLEHALVEAKREATEPNRPDHFDSEFEEKVCNALRDRGFKVSTQEPVASFFVDLVVEDAEGRVLGVECDGEWKHDEFGLLRPQDYQRQDIIERAGWAVHRISGLAFYLNPVAEIDRVVAALKQQRTTEDLRLAVGPIKPAEPAPPAEAWSPAPTTNEVELADSEPLEPQFDVADTGGDIVPVESVIAESPTDAAFSFMGEISVEPRFAVQGLYRWYMRRNELERSAEDELNSILEMISRSKPLSAEQIDYLKALWDGAVRRGFDPDDDLLIPVA